MAHTASTGSAKRTVDVAGKRLGIKRFGGEFVNAGEILVRQRGSKFYPGLNTSEGRDFTIFATVQGFVSYRRMNGYKRNQSYVDVLPTQRTETPVKLVKGIKTAVKKEVKAEKIEKPVVKKAPAKKPAAKKTAK